jgi:hypothetical protein
MIPDVGPLAIFIALILAATAKFYHAWRNRSWMAFADGMARVGLSAFYLVNYLAALQGSAAGSDESRALARIGILGVFAIEASVWVLGLFKRKAAKP